MTVISTIFTKNKIAVASDGYITKNGSPIQEDVVKYIKFDRVPCVVSFWGCASYDNWHIRDWLERQNKYLNEHPEKECENLEQLSLIIKNELQNALNTGVPLKRLSNSEKGIGLHIAGFEEVENGLLAPELFLVTNFSLDKYGYYYVQQNTLDCTRRSIVDFVPREIIDAPVADRKKYVYDNILNKGTVIIYNNGDPIMFNNFSRGYGAALMRASEKKLLKDVSDDERLKRLATWSIEKVKDFQSEFYLPEKIAVGGKISSNILTIDGQWI